MSLRATLALTVEARLTSAPDVGAAKYDINETFKNVLSNGTGLNQANNTFADDFTIVGAGAQTYDLAGALTNPLGTVIFTAIKALLIVNTGTSPLVYGGGTNPLAAFMGAGTHTVTIAPGGMMLLVDPTAAGQPVTAATGDILRIAGTDAAGTIIIFGES